jgi:hypothetical protein
MRCRPPYQGIKFGYQHMICGGLRIYKLSIYIGSREISTYLPKSQRFRGGSRFKSIGKGYNQFQRLWYPLYMTSPPETKNHVHLGRSEGSLSSWDHVRLRWCSHRDGVGLNSDLVSGSGWEVPLDKTCTTEVTLEKGVYDTWLAIMKMR